jgi:hypothetical protein
LRDFIETKVSEYFTTVYNPKHKVNLKITQSWTNYTDKGQYHHKHEHPNSFVSGVFYVQADKAKDRIYFYRNGYQQIKFPPSDWNVWNSESWWFDTCQWKAPTPMPTDGKMYSWDEATTSWVEIESEVA